MNAKLIARSVANALREELDATPKPGLVDRSNCGAHADMDYSVMSEGIRALTPFFGMMYILAREGADAGKGAEEISARLKMAGISAERAMLSATKGVNTHKGAIFCMGNAVGAIGLTEGRGERPTVENLNRALQELARGAMDELEAAKHKSKNTLTAGERLFVERGEAGARGQAANGYSFVLFECLPLAKKLFAMHDTETAKVRLLCFVMSRLFDSNVFKRGGFEAVEYVRTRGAELFDNFSLENVVLADKDFIQRNLSPGGAADTLALTLFLHCLSV